MKYRALLKILHQHGFEQTRQRGSHRAFKRVTKRRTYVVMVSYHQLNDDIAPKTLASMIRQSGLPKKAFL